MTNAIQLTLTRDEGILLSSFFRDCMDRAMASGSLTLIAVADMEREPLDVAMEMLPKISALLDAVGGKRTKA